MNSYLYLTNTAKASISCANAMNSTANGTNSIAKPVNYRGVNIDHNPQLKQATKIFLYVHKKKAIPTNKSSHSMININSWYDSTVHYRS